ncbi:MAG: response regulator transcription factor [Bacteroidetes bacterium]|nr:response regulator transcription factor [Bacteroidota bacterium]
MEKIRIIIADDHELILKGISVILRSYPDFEIVGEATNGKEVVALTLQLTPDIVFMDISMPDLSGIEACRQILRHYPDTRIIALSQHEDGEYVYQMLKAGGSGYMLKDSSKEEFGNAIQSVLAGEKYFSAKISEIMITDLMHRKEQENSSDLPPVHITRREKEIIEMIADDLSNQAIGEKLHISQRTVETHRRNIMQKLNVKSVVALLKYAVKHNLISLE